MSKTTSSFSFYVRKSKANKQGLAPLELSIVINQTRVFINLPQKFSPEEFNKRRQPKVIQDAIQEWRYKIDTILVDMMRNDIPVTAERLREYIKTGGVKSYTTEDMFNEFLELQKQRVGISLTKSVYRKYELVAELFFQNYDKTQECTTITNGVVRRFYAILDNKYDNSTATGYKTKFKAFVTYGMDNDKIRINPFQGIKIVKEKKPIDYLTQSEIDKLINTPIENQSLSKVRDCAVFQICSGIAYCDIVALVPEDMKEDNGVYYINKRRLKTGTEYTSVILPEGIGIWKKYEGKLPIISNQKYNSYLKVIGDLCGLKTSLHSHLFRHTYATLLLNNGVSIKTIAKACGHTNSKITESFYAHLEDKTVLSEVSKAFIQN